MIQELSNYLSGMTRASGRLNAAASNIANINSNGYVSRISSYSSENYNVFKYRDGSSSGYYISTGRPLDLAVNGNGYFKLTKGDETYFLKSGVFNIDADGNITDLNGGILSSTGGIRGEVTVDKNGNVFVDGVLVDTLSTYASDGTKLNNSTYEVLSGYLEVSDVDAAKEIVSMITAQREFEANLVSVKKTDDMVGNLLNIVA